MGARIAIQAPAKKPVFATKRVGQLLVVSDGKLVRELPMRASPVAVDVERRIHFWHAADPSLTVDELIVKAILEHDCAVYAQRRRRFGRCF